MSNILKGILNESNPFYGHNDPAREYGAEDPSYPKRGRHSQTDDDDEYDPYGLIRQEKDFAKGRAMKAAAEKAQRDSDHDRLATGTNEGLDDPWGDQGNFAGDKPVNLGNVSMKNIQTGDTVKYLGQPSKVVAISKDRKYSRITISKGTGTVTQDVLTSDLQQLGRGTTIEEDNNTRMRMNDYYDLADAIQEKLRHAIQIGDKARIQELNKQRDELDARVKQYGLMPEDVAEGSKKEEEYGPEWDEKIKRIGQMAKEGPRKTVWDPVKRVYKTVPVKQSGIKQGINEFSPGATGPKGPKDYGQPNSSRYLAVQGPNKFVVGTTNNYVLTATIDKWGLEWDEDDEIWYLDSPGAAHIADASEGEIELPPPREQRNQIHDLVTDYLNARNSADLQKVALYYGHTPDGEMATNESSEAPRFNSKQEVINHFVKNGKSAAAGAAAWERGYRGSSKKPIELKKPPQRSYHDELDDKRYASIDENLGDQLKSTSLDALVQAKLAIEKQRQAEIDAWSQDFQKNTVQKAQQGLRRELQPTPVAQPGEKHSVLKARLAQLNNAIQKQELLDKLVDRLERRGILTPAMQNDADTTMHVRYGSKDNYESLNKKLDNAIQTLQSRLNIRKISGLKEVHDERDEYDNPRQGRDYGKGNLFIDPGSTEFKKEVHIGSNDGERGRPKNLKGVSKSLPADAFGRTTGKIPAGKRGTVHSKMGNTDEVDEGWSQKYKSSINCSHPKGFSQKAHCAGKKKHNESIDNIMEMTCPDCGMCETHGDNSKDKLDELKCWSGYHRVAGTKAGFPGSCAKNKTNEEQHSESCPHCGGEMVSEELMNEKKDACYYKVKSRYKVWPSAYASGALVKCRNKGASNWGNGGKKNESSILEGINRVDESLHDWFNKEKWVRMDTKGEIKGPCAREPGEGKPKCLPQSKAHSLGKKGRASAAQRKRREDPNPDRSGKAINVDTKKSKG